jgi:uncharacterized SAM-binding protein YcdF (DUF218 family)
VTRADAVIVLSGSRFERLPKALQIMRRGVSPVLVISDGRDPRWHQANRLCAGHGGFRTICFRPRPYSTRGEAREIARLARSRGWRTIVVVSSTYHVRRARMIFRRCFSGRVEMVGARPHFDSFLNGAVYEWPKLLYAVTLGRGC